jgi:uncharacterized protein with ATP-grasp and redox domains
LYDLENGIVMDAEIAPIAENERALAEGYLRVLQGLDSYKDGHRELIIFDRGYPSYELIKSLSDKEIAYLPAAGRCDAIAERLYP